jgi:putative tricarboxylic transport membrane protein
VICTIGAYTVHNNIFDVVMMLVFGVAGYLLKKCNYPLAPLVLAIVLGDKAEAIPADLAGWHGCLLLERTG